MQSPIDVNRHTFRSSKFRSVVKEAVDFFVKTPVHPLSLKQTFEGTGVYALYYNGKYPLYTSLSRVDDTKFVRPLYVGKAVPQGWRQGRHTGVIGSILSGRISQHSRSIQQVPSLKTEDFVCRFVILIGEESDLIVPLEAELIRLFQPLWNGMVDGFGNHDPGKGRYKQAKSEWDVLHPGRKWAERLTGPKPKVKTIKNKVEGYMKKLN